MTAHPSVLVVGAGLSGVLAARGVAATAEVTVVEKSRGVGGRLATRRLGPATFDHGAQFFTAQSPVFTSLVTEWLGAGVAAPWFSERLEPDGSTMDDGHQRYRGAPGMTALAKHEARGLHVVTGTCVARLEVEGARWRAVTDAGQALDADAVVLTAPVPQSLALLDAGGVALSDADRHTLEALTYDRCLAVLAVLDAPSGLAAPGALRPASEPIDWLADNHLKGISAVPALTVHAAAAFSLAHWGDTDADVCAALLAAAPLPLVASVVEADVQRWRYAKPTTPHTDRFLMAAGLPPLLFAGDAFGSARVEGAALSGMAVASELRQWAEGSHGTDVRG